MKNIFLIISILCLALTGQAQIKVSQLAPCKDANGAPVAGCKLVTDLAGNWIEAIYSQTNCVNGDLLIEYVDHAGTVVHIETYEDSCTDPTSTCHPDCNGDLKLIHNAVTGTIEFMIADAATNQLIFDFSNFIYLGNDVASSVDVSVNFELSGTPMTVAGGLTSTGFSIPNLLYTYPNDGCPTITISFTTDNGLYFSMQYSLNIAGSSISNVDAGASIPDISFDSDNCEVTVTGFENQGDSELTTFSANGQTLHSYGFHGALTSSDLFVIDGSGIDLNTPIVLQTLSAEATGCPASNTITVQTFALICE